MSDILRILVSPGFRTGVYAGNAIWHSMAFLNFTFRPKWMIEKLTNPALTKVSKKETSGDEYTQDMMRYLGGINGGYAILAFLRFLPLAISLFNVNDDQRINLKIKEDHQITVTADLLCFTALGLANISQAILNFFYAKPSGRWIVGHWRGLKTDRITILDSLFTVLDFSIVGARLAGF